MLKSVTCSTLRHMTKLSMIPPSFSANSLVRLWSGSHARQCVQAQRSICRRRAGRNALTTEDRLTTTEIRKAVRTLKKNKARPFCEGGRQPHFICICSPEATYDLQNDEMWKKRFDLQQFRKLSTAEKSEDCSVLCLLKALRPKYFLRAFTMPLKRLRPHQKLLCLKTRPPKRRKNISPSAATPFISGAMNTRWIPKPRTMRIQIPLS